ncbi:Ig-like domain-containing protein [Mesorhizobium sp.]|uniref:beta strand repeat-containing protein n=2 Tax=Mesorhizobium sp. TaxID=1871066 RepID=UPI000FE36089|nr:Ig-like domain-containing protein [Mesorhizobium sp.]RWK08359.1 MAG: adhesin [Mesorhizobium sp.]RWK15246.1 MAG: adhesin [Mesorhizobium sp.]RWK30555.1 MAG: adhesin [Mesorhizobium sp.]TIQ56612.1 MAG: adhesin [Mesorhizobium sp.]
MPTQTELSGTAFTGYDSYDGGNGAVQLGKAGSTPDADTLQIWLSAAQLNDTAIMAEIAYFKNVWLPGHISAQTSQADSSVYTFKTLDLKVTGVEKVVVLDSAGKAPVAINIVDSALNDSDNNSIVTFTFTGPVTGFTAADVTASHGTLTDFAMIDASHYTAKFTAQDGFDGIGSVSVTAGSYTDTAGNAGAGGSDTATVDTANPTVVVDLDRDTFDDHHNTSAVTFTFSEVPSGFDASDISVSGGSISGLTQDLAGDPSGKTYTATFTADDNSTAPVSISVGANTFTDPVGNDNTASNTDTATVDTANPTVVVDLDRDTFDDHHNTSAVTFTFSEVPSGFDASDISVSGGSISGLTQDLAGDPSGKTYTATFTADDNSTAPVSISVGANTFTDPVGNDNTASNTDTATVDTANPTVVVDVVAASLSDGTPSSNVTFTFSEAPGVSFTAADITATNGTISGFTQDTATTYHATFTATDGISATGSVSVAAGSYTDAVGNTGSAGSDTVTIDRVNPTVAVDIVATSLSDGTPSSNVTFTFSEAPGVSFTAADITATNGTISGFTQDTATTYHATFTATDGISATGSVSVAAGSYTDAVGNTGSAGSDTVAIDTGGDTTAPTVVISHNNSGAKQTITFTFSEAVSGFDLNDIVLVGATATAGTFVHVGIDGTGHDIYTLDVTKPVGGGAHTVQVLSSGTGTSSWTDLAGNPGVGTPAFNLPAGTAGEPINLALTDPSDGQAVTVTIKDVPSGWTIDGATQNADGSWTVQTNAVHELTVTTPASFAGAVVLDVSMTWTNADGTTGSASIADNVEAYAPGSPIFAWSGDDVLTGSSGNDLFVFSQPIGNDTVHSFDAAADQIDLIGYSAFQSFADVQAHMADDGNGNAVIMLADGQSITLDGVHSSALGAGNFVFDQTPVVNNPGAMTIGDGALLPLSGTVNNSGTISLDSTGSETLLQVIQHGVTLEGGGQVVLSDSAFNIISGTGPDVTLTNVDNMISGAGQLGDGMLSLDNRGTIIASGSNALVIDTGGSVVANSGTLEATGSGGLVIAGGVANSGMLEANGGNIVIHGAVTGDGDATIGNLSKLEFGAASSTDVTFAQNAAGTLELDDSFDYSGLIGGITNDDKLDLNDISFGAGTTVSYQASQDGSGGTLTVSDGAHNATLHLLGTYDASGFKLADDGEGHTVVTYNPADFTLTGVAAGASEFG